MPIIEKYCNHKNNTNCVTCLKKRFSLLDGLSDTELACLERRRTLAKYSAGETIYKEGTKPSGLLCLSAGKAKVIKIGPRNKEQIISLNKPVDFIGFSELMAGEAYATSCVAIEESSVCIIDKADFFSVVKGNTDFFMKVTRYLSSEIHHTANRIIALCQKNLRARLADALLYLKDVYGMKTDNQTINVILKRADIAAISNMTTANVIRTLSAFRSEGIIENNRKAIRILNPDELINISRTRENGKG
jgi:CRP/FNR family transcriptional regulator, polysaccharide utilization system transcription regulator